MLLLREKIIVTVNVTMTTPFPVEEVRRIADECGLTENPLNETSRVSFSSKDNVRHFNVYLFTRSVGTHCPKDGDKQLFRRNVNVELLKEMFIEPARHFFAKPDKNNNTKTPKCNNTTAESRKTIAPAPPSLITFDHNVEDKVATATRTSSSADSAQRQQNSVSTAVEASLSDKKIPDNSSKKSVVSSNTTATASKKNATSKTPLKKKRTTKIKATATNHPPKKKAQCNKSRLTNPKEKQVATRAAKRLLTIKASSVAANSTISTPKTASTTASQKTEIEPSSSKKKMKAPPPPLTWEDMFLQLVLYRARNNNSCNVPKGFVVEVSTSTNDDDTNDKSNDSNDGIKKYKLGDWVSKMRRFDRLITTMRPELSERTKKEAAIAVSELTAERKEALTSIGMEWGIPRDGIFKHSVWEKNYQELKQWHDEHGNCSPTPNTKLSRWVQMQKTINAHVNGTKLKRSKKEIKRKPPMELTENNKEIWAQRKAKLDELGMVWSRNRKVTWEDQVQFLKEFKEENGHTRVPQHYVHNRSLGKWVAKMR